MTQDLPRASIMQSAISRLMTREESTVSDELRTQWSAPSDVLSILLLLGDDVVQISLAQLAGGLITPAVFSFGWVSYAVKALLSAVGDNRLMPSSPDYPCLLINGKSGYVRENRSWIISRILRDFDTWKDPNVEIEEKKLLASIKKPTTQGAPDRQPQAPLSVSFYNVTNKRKAGVGDYDFIWFFSYVVILVQFGIAAIPCGLSDDWSILTVTAAGTVLAWVTGALPQWREEKFEACRKNSKKTFVITSGNGTKDVIVIRGCGLSLDLEDLAGARARTSRYTRICLFVLAILWIGLLIMVAGLKENTWFLLGVGGIGMLQNILVAGLPRKPGAQGIHLQYEKTIAKEKVMLTLMAVEDFQPFLGRSLLNTFFPGELREEEVKWWEEAKSKAKPGAHAPQAAATPAIV